MAQINALKKETKKKKTIYLKNSKRTLKHCMQFCDTLGLKGFLPVDQYI